MILFCASIFEQLLLWVSPRNATSLSEDGRQLKRHTVIPVPDLCTFSAAVAAAATAADEICFKHGWVQFNPPIRTQNKCQTNNNGADVSLTSFRQHEVSVIHPARSMDRASYTQSQKCHMCVHFHKTRKTSRPSKGFEYNTSHPSANQNVHT